MVEHEKIKCLIVDDEPLAIRVIQNHLEKVPFAKVAATATSAMEALNKLRELPVDLVFLDIDMPEISGIDLIRGLPDPPAFIFVTAFREFAADAFDLDALDYLVKPVSFPRFLKAINKYKDINTEASGNSPQIQVRSDRSVQNISIDQISYIEGLKDYIKIFLENDKMVITRETMSGIEQLLSDHGFMRCHKSFVISLGRVQKFSNDKLEIDGDTIPIGRKYRENIIKALQG